MKLLLVVLSAFVFQFAAARADMVIVQKVEGAGQSSEMTMKLKGDKIRTDVSPQMSTITNAATGDVTTIMHTQKSYMTIPASSSKALMEQMQKSMQQQNGGAPAPSAKLQSTGKKEVINGYNTEQYTSAIGGMKVTYWISSEFPNWKKVLEAMQSFQRGGLATMAKGMMPDYASFPGIPVKTEVDFGGQKITTTLASAEEKDVDAKEFEIPAGYTEMKMPTFNMPLKSPAE